MSTLPYWWRASASVRPTVPIGGWEKTAVATCSWSKLVGLSWKTVAANAAPSRMATGVRLMRSVTSPTAQMLSAVVFENSSTLTAPRSLSSTPDASRPRSRTWGSRPVANITCSVVSSMPLER